MALPISQIDIQKQQGAEYWSNRYLCEFAVGSAEAEAAATALINAEKAMLFNNVLINKVRIATLTPNDNVFQAWNPNTFGSRNAVGLSLLPLFCVVRIDFGAGLGRPSRKYIRGALSESDVQGANLESGFLSGVATPYGNAVSGLAGIVDPQGDDLNGFSVYPQIAMRQLRRGSRRRSEPVL